MGIRQIISLNLKKYRGLSDLTQDKLAELCDSDSCYIRQIELGKKAPSVDYIEKLAKALNIAPYELFYDEAYSKSEEFLARQREQKEKIKAMLTENVAHICSMVDEGY